MQKLRILIADDNEMFQDLIARFLSSHEAVEVIGIAETGEEAISAVAEHRPHVVIIDLNMPHNGAVKAPKAVKQQFPETRVYLCSASPEDALQTSVTQFEIDGYILKDDLKAGLTEMLKNEQTRSIQT